MPHLLPRPIGPAVPRARSAGSRPAIRPLRAAAPPMLLALAMVLTGCHKAVPEKVEAPRPVRSVVVAPRDTVASLTLPAEIRPRIEARYGFRVGGKIAQRMVNVGDRVAPGQVLARLDPQDAAPAVAAAQASLEAARTDARLALTELARLKDLREKNFISAGQLDRQQATSDAATSRAQAAEAQLRQARNAVDFQVLKADVAGHVIGLDAEAGQVVAAGQVVVRVARDGEYEALVNVPERDFGRARGAVQWKVNVPALGERSLTGKMRELSPVADAASRTYPMRLTISGDLAGLQWGMSATVSVATGTGASFVLPLSALTSKDGTPHVWLVDAATQTVRPVAVRTDGLLDDTVRVAEGLKAGDRVVTAGANLLIAGQKIKLADDAR